MGDYPNFLRVFPKTCTPKKTGAVEGGRKKASMQTSIANVLGVFAALLSTSAASYGAVTFRQLHLFPVPGPSAPSCTLVETSRGVFYGTTSTGSGAAARLSQS